ncbi:hypothetical protein HPB47_018453 [Ixodes persulcatus]|uniref:Uncharacterized protein n=1 Tax=Ixodes persulcatus TaxID=34615 RepID=A0AC60QZU9_IXOPE|nr:hypothetical protein HPB47_018453 [Ixodes persulcatus]
MTGVPGTIGRIDRPYIAIQSPANKIRSTYQKKHHYPSQTLQAICDRNKRFLDITMGHPSKVKDARVFRTLSMADKLSQICRRYYILGDAVYPLREYLMTLFREFESLTKNRETSMQLKLLEFVTVYYATRFTISSCILHNLCIEAGEGDVVQEPENEASSVPDNDSLEVFGPLTASDSVLRKLGGGGGGRRGTG